MTSPASQLILQKNGRRKALFIQGMKEAFMEDVIEVAKTEALKIGLGSQKALLRVLKCEYDFRLDGWNVVLQALW